MTLQNGFKLANCNENLHFCFQGVLVSVLETMAPQDAGPHEILLQQGSSLLVLNLEVTQSCGITWFLKSPISCKLWNWGTLQFLTQFFFLLQNPVLFVIPMKSLLGRLPLFPAGDTGTIPFKSIASNLAEHEALAERTYPGAFCDKEQGSGDDCLLWHLIMFALKWFSYPQ